MPVVDPVCLNSLRQELIAIGCPIVTLRINLPSHAIYGDAIRLDVGFQQRC